MYDNIKKDDIVLYCGGEEMDMCGLVAMWGGKLVVIEPNDRVFPNGKAIWEANKLENPLACFVGFAANKTDLKGTEIILNGFPECANGEVIGDHGFKELSKEFDVVPQIKIDDLVSMTGIVPNHISVDCEGSEFEIIRGAEQTLLNHKPLLWISIHPEFMFDQWKEYSGDLRNWIKDRGYKETLLAYQHECHFFYQPK